MQIQGHLSTTSKIMDGYIWTNQTLTHKFFEDRECNFYGAMESVSLWHNWSHIFCDFRSRVSRSFPLHDHSSLEMHVGNPLIFFLLPRFLSMWILSIIWSQQSMLWTRPCLTQTSTNFYFFIAIELIRLEPWSLRGSRSSGSRSTFPIVLSRELIGFNMESPFRVLSVHCLKIGLKPKVWKPIRIPSLGWPSEVPCDIPEVWKAYYFSNCSLSCSSLASPLFENLGPNTYQAAWM